jgi:exodeoxyribonuclease VII small subunit
MTLQPSSGAARIRSHTMPKKIKPEDQQDCPAFEDSLAELEQIVAKLEGGKLPLSDALAAYELGVRRLNNCYQILEHAERRIELVQSVDAGGHAQTVPLEDAEGDDLAEKSTSRSRRRTATDPALDGRVDDASSLF